RHEGRAGNVARPGSKGTTAMKLFRIVHADGKRWRTLDSIGMPDWTDDPKMALTMTLRMHADAFAGDDPEDVRIEEVPALDHAALLERTAQLIAHRVCCGTEHDPSNGKLHGYCVVCGVVWPCEYAGTPPAKTS